MPTIRKKELEANTKKSVKSSDNKAEKQKEIFNMQNTQKQSLVPIQDNQMITQNARTLLNSDKAMFSSVTNYLKRSNSSQFQQSIKIMEEQSLFRTKMPLSKPDDPETRTNIHHR